MLTPCSNSGIRTTCQFNAKIFYPNKSKPTLWETTQLSHYEVSEDRMSFYADDCAVELSEDGTYYTIKSMNSENAIVNLKVTRMSPGFHAGKTGKTLFGTDMSKPWGTMRHAFWPRCITEGTITTKDGAVDFKGRAFYVYALQGMKPHHAAAKWNFVDFQGPNYSAVMMEYTTPPSYGSTTVSVGGIAKDGEMIYGGVTQTAKHTKAKNDSVNEWPEPEEIKFTWSGTDKDGKAVEGVIEGSLGERLDRVDVLAEVPGFVKKIVAGTAGTKPYIYQVSYLTESPVAPRTKLITITVLPDREEAHLEAQDWRQRNLRRGSLLQRGDLHLRIDVWTMKRRR